MGYYINPPDMTKEEFLKKHGTEASVFDIEAHDFKSDELPVCLCHNGAFTAAGIIYDFREGQAFTQGDDPRPKKFFKVKKELLKPYLPERFHDV